MTVREKIGKNEAVFWIALGAFVTFLGWRIKIGTFRAPGPGFFALVAGLALIIIGGFMLFSGTKSKANSKKSLHGNSAGGMQAFLKWRLAATMGLLIAYAFFLSSAGYLVCTFVVMWGLFYDWGKNRLLKSCFASLATTAVTYLIFQTWLQTQLPRGILPWW